MIPLIFKDKNLILWISFFSSTLSFFTNEIGFYFKFWNLYPWELEYLSAIPFNLGLFALFPLSFITLIDLCNVKPTTSILLIDMLTLVAEFFGLLVGRVI
jgi:hypothetical protein